MISNKIYNADIIRALAIIFVVIFHFFEELMPFGWLGVDMFFLLSGFLITNLFFFRELKTFLFERLIRIILPLIFFLFFISTILLFLIKPIYWADMIFMPFIASIFGVSNFFFFNFQDYFNKINYQPNLHLWSLGLEIQFILLLSILFFIKKNRLHFFGVLFIIFLSSFILNFITSNEVIKFYLTPFRLYEFLTGSLIRIIYDSFKKKINFPGLNFIAILFVILLIFLAMGIFELNRFQVITFGLIISAFLLTFFFTETIKYNQSINQSVNQSVNQSINQSNKLLLFNNYLFLKIQSIVTLISTRSYSIYLFHFPGAFFVKTLSLNTFSILIILFFVLILAELFYRIVDFPIQKKRLNFSSIKKFLFFNILIFIFIILYKITFNNDYLFLKNYNLTDSQNERLTKSNIVVIGDSHMVHAKLLLDKLNLPIKYEGINCLPVPNTTNIYSATNFSEKNEKCVVQNSGWNEKYAEYKFLILQGRWSYPFLGKFNKKNIFNMWTDETRLVGSASDKFTEITMQQSKVIFENEMENLAKYILKNDKILLIFGEVPPLGRTPTGCERLISKLQKICEKDFYTKMSALEQLKYTSNFFLSLEKKYHGHLFFIDVSKDFCPTQFDKEIKSCINNINNVFLYRDDNHLDINNILLIKDKFYNQMTNSLFKLENIFKDFNN
jgi:peptidoglycan/LPS O-acetylase OafA/YrhL